MRILFVWLMIALSLFANDLNSTLLTNATSTQWKNIDKTIQTYIIKNEKTITEKIIPAMAQPIKLPTQEEIETFQVPKLLYTRQDIKTLLTYTKYLIDQNKTQEATDIYIQAINGLNNADKSYSMINTIFHIVINGIVLKSLEYDLSYLSKEDKALLQSKVPKLFILTMKEFDKALENETKIVLKELKSYLTKVLPQKRVDRIISKLEHKVLNFNNTLYNMNSIEAQKKMMASTIEKKQKFMQQYATKISFIKQEATKYRENNTSFYTYVKNLPQMQDEKYFSDKMIVDGLFYHSFLHKFIMVQDDCKRVIELNQKVLKQL